MTQQRFAPIETDVFVPAGGLNEVSPPLRLKPGAAREMENMFCAVDGGYTRTRGAEFWCNGTAAEDQAFAKMTLSIVGGGEYTYMGARIAGVTSGASARLVWIKGDTVPLDPYFLEALGLGMYGVTHFFTAGSTVIYIFQLKGVFQLGETFNITSIFDEATVTGTGTIGAVPTDLDTTTPTTYATERLECDKFWRVMQSRKPPYAIGASPYTVYTKPNLALQEVDGDVWLFRPAIWNLDGTVRMIANVASNQSIDDTITPFHEERNFIGAWYGHALLNADCWPIEPDYVDTVAYNFGLGKKIYGVTGIGKAFEFDPATTGLSAITTGMPVDAPTRLAVHKNRLFVAFSSSVQWSAAADPFTWSVIVGAGEINVGDEVTSMHSVIGSDSSSALVIATRTKLCILYGDSVANFTLVTVSPEIGVHPATFQQFGVPLFMSDFGVTTLAAAQTFGNFAAATITSQVQKFINEHRSKATCSVLVRSLNQYRIFFNDRTALYITMSGAGKPLGITPMRFPFTVRRAISLINPVDDKEITLVITEEHDRVLRLDTGRRFDNDPIDFFAILAYNNMRSARELKAFRKAVLEIQAETGYVQFYAGADVDYGGYYRKASLDQLVQDPNINQAASWDVFNWDEFTYDASPLTPVDVKIDGTGENVSLRMRNRSEMVDSFTWTAGILHYSKRRSKR